MDAEERKRKRLIKLAITEGIMVVAIILMVVIFVAVNSGYRLHKDLAVEQEGLVQIDSLPTGATVEIDGETMFARTNMNRMLPVGQHKIALSKDGYDSWSKTVEVSPGRLLRIQYPRLFKNDRTAEPVWRTNNLKFLSANVGRSTLLYSIDNTTKWSWMNIRGLDQPTAETVDVAGVFTGTDGGVFEQGVEQVIWSDGGERVLVKSGAEWAVIFLRKTANSFNISKSLGSFSDVQFYNEAGDQLLVLKEGNLYKYSLGAEKLEKPLLTGVESFTTYGQEILFVKAGNELEKRGIYLFREGDEKSVLVKEAEGDATVRVAIQAYAGEQYIDYTIGERLVVIKMEDYPTNGKFEDTPLIDSEIGLVPAEKPVISRTSEFMILKNGDRAVVFDAEQEQYFGFSYGGSEVRWLDDNLLYEVSDGALIVQDFDGLNKRVIVEKAVADYTATISDNNRWLYYVATAENGELVLTRERL